MDGRAEGGLRTPASHQFHAQHPFWHEKRRVGCHVLLHLGHHYADATWYLVLLDGQPVGRLYVARWPDDIRVVDIALMPEHRGGGLGTRLLRGILAEGDASGRKVSIHVEIFNPARSLYERLGFVQAEEKGVYLLMERHPAAVPA